MRALSTLCLLLTFGSLAGEAAAATAGMAFLRLGSSARTAALSEAVTAVAGAEATSYNPGALTGPSALSLTHGEWIGDIRHDYLTGIWSRGESVWGLSLQVSQADDLERRTGPSAVPLGDFGVYEWAAALAWSRPAGEALQVGAAARLLRQSIYDQAATGAAVDVGALYRLSESLTLGGAVRQVGALGNLDREATDLPLQVRAGATYRAAPPPAAVGRRPVGPGWGGLPSPGRREPRRPAPGPAGRVPDRRWTGTVPGTGPGAGLGCPGLRLRSPVRRTG